MLTKEEEDDDDDEEFFMSINRQKQKAIGVPFISDLRIRSSHMTFDI